jgi:hypothetical protein
MGQLWLSRRHRGFSTRTIGRYRRILPNPRHALAPPSPRQLPRSPAPLPQPLHCFFSGDRGVCRCWQQSEVAALRARVEELEATAQALALEQVYPPVEQWLSQPLTRGQTAGLVGWSTHSAPSKFAAQDTRFPPYRARRMLPRVARQPRLIGGPHDYRILSVLRTSNGANTSPGR